MMRKIFKKIKEYIRENYKFLLFLIIFSFIISYPVPYYIHSTGGLIDITNKVSFDGEYKSRGSFNFAYVTETKGNVLTYLLSYVLKDWDLIKKEDVEASNESYEDLSYRNHMFLKQANQNAILVAFNKLNKEVKIKKYHNYLVYIDSISNTDLEIEDEIISVNNIVINTSIDYVNILKNSNVGDKLKAKVYDKNNKLKTRYIEVLKDGDGLTTGIYFITIKDFDLENNIKFNFESIESGPSGGLMMAVTIYDKLVKEDLTLKKTIVGTGVIDEYGNVSEIGGIKYKLKGAVKEKADIFFVPKENYKEALSLKNKNNYNIELVKVSTFDDVINYLMVKNNKM